MQKIVGSTAAIKSIPGFKRNYIKDLDVWSTEPLENSKGLDWHIFSEEILKSFETDLPFASLSDLYTIKISHLPYDIRWWHHVQDALVMKKHGAEINFKLYNLLKKHWIKEHGNKEFLNLNRPADEFFNDYVEKKYLHDYLHELVSYPADPVYKSVLKDGKQVLTDKNKFLSLPFENKVKMLREEMCVIMVERWLIHPRIRDRISYAQAWRMSVRKTTTALTKGIYSEFICENLEHFVHPNKSETEYLFKELEIT